MIVWSVENSRFNDDSEGRSPLSIDEPVYQVSGHLGRTVVQRKKPHVVLLSLEIRDRYVRLSPSRAESYPGLSQLDHVADALVLLLLPGEPRQGSGEVRHLLGVDVVEDPVGCEL